MAIPTLIPNRIPILPDRELDPDPVQVQAWSPAILIPMRTPTVPGKVEGQVMVRVNRAGPEGRTDTSGARTPILTPSLASPGSPVATETGETARVGVPR